MSKVLDEILPLSIDEKLAIIDAIWQSIPAKEETLPIPAWHQQELEKRLNDLAENPDQLTDWEDFKNGFEK